MNLNDLTLGEVKELRSMFGGGGGCSGCSGNESLMPKIGEKVFIKTATYFYAGLVCEVGGGWVRLEKASWVAETGRFSTAMKAGDFSAVEPFPDNVHPRVNLSGAGVIWANWPHELPRVAK